jgi:hypothetical protein
MPAATSVDDVSALDLPLPAERPQEVGVEAFFHTDRGSIASFSHSQLWGDRESRDVLAGDGEVPLEIGGAAGEVAG